VDASLFVADHVCLLVGLEWDNSDKHFRASNNRCMAQLWTTRKCDTKLQFSQQMRPQNSQTLISWNRCKMCVPVACLPAMKLIIFRNWMSVAVLVHLI